MRHAEGRGNRGEALKGSLRVWEASAQARELSRSQFCGRCEVGDAAGRQVRGPVTASAPWTGLIDGCVRACVRGERQAEIDPSAWVDWGARLKRRVCLACMVVRWTQYENPPGDSTCVCVCARDRRGVERRGHGDRLGP